MVLCTLLSGPAAAVNSSSLMVLVLPQSCSVDLLTLWVAFMRGPAAPPSACCCCCRSTWGCATPAAGSAAHGSSVCCLMIPARSTRWPLSVPHSACNSTDSVVRRTSLLLPRYDCSGQAPAGAAASSSDPHSSSWTWHHARSAVDAMVAQVQSAALVDGLLSRPRKSFALLGFNLQSGEVQPYPAGMWQQTVQVKHLSALHFILMFTSAGEAIGC